jgi:hypothetical protein
MGIVGRRVGTLDREGGNVGGLVAEFQLRGHIQVKPAAVHRHLHGLVIYCDHKGVADDVFDPMGLPALLHVKIGAHEQHEGFGGSFPGRFVCARGGGGE